MPIPAYVIATASAAALAVGHFSGNWLLGSVAASSGLCMLGLFSSRAGVSARPNRQLDELSPLSADELDGADPAEKMLRQGRASLLLRPMLMTEVKVDAAEELKREFREQMAFIHPGAVRVASWAKAAEGQADGGEAKVQVEGYWIDRNPVTNRQFAKFVAAGGYLNLSFWRDESHPLVNQFLDQGGQPGPRFWQHGRFLEAEGDHPVVGVSWYESDAFATWAGKRLPSDPEWVKAAAWPFETENQVSQWTFPWGNQLRADQARLGSSKQSGPCRVSEHKSGQNPVGVRHLIGNVWEWMHDDFCLWDQNTPFPPDSALASVRGGAFDTFFEAQATAAFFSAERRAERRGNIGFRCAVSAVDVACEPTARAAVASSAHSRTAAKTRVFLRLGRRADDSRWRARHPSAGRTEGR